MQCEEVAERALELRDAAEQRRYLLEHDVLHDDSLGPVLKGLADQALRSDVARSRRVSELLLRVAEWTQNPLQRALGLLAEANARSIGLGEYRQAIELYDEAASIYHDQGRLLEEARSQIGKVGSLAHLGRYEEAFETGAWASQVLEEQEEWQILAGLMVNVAIVYGRAGDDAGSLEAFDRAQALYARLGAENEPPWLWVQMNRGIALRNLGRFEEALESGRTAWEGQLRLGQKLAAARAEQSLACTYLMLGRYNEALAHLDQVRDVFLGEGLHRDAMLVELFVSDCLLQLRRFGDVLEKCRQVRELFAKIGSDHVVAQAIVNEAVAYTQLARHAEARASLAEARRIFEAEGNEVSVTSTDLERAAVLLREGRHGESQAVALACAATFREHHLPVEEAQAQLVVAHALLAQGHHDQALALARKTLETGEQKRIPTLCYQSHQLWGDVALAQERRQEALAAYGRAIEHVERLRGRLMVEFRSDFLAGQEEIYQDAVGLCLDLGEAGRGLEYAERAKSRALLDLLLHRLDLSITARSSADGPMVDELIHLRTRRDQLQRHWADDVKSGERGWTSSTGERTQAQQEILDLETRITQLWHRLLIRNADYAREASLHTVHIEPAHPYLSGDALLVEYFVVRGELVAFLVTAEGVQARRLGCRLSQVEAMLRLLWLNLRSVPCSGSDQAGALTANAQGVLQQLYRLLLAPLSDALEVCRQLIVVPHGALHYLPFHALRDGESYLLERLEVSYLPGSSFLRHCLEFKVTDGGALALGHSAGSRLPYAVEEARAVAQLLGGETLLEDEIRLGDLSRLMPGYRTLHLATHGDFRPDNPLFSGLALPEGWLTTLDIFGLRLRASLVTLSACQTGRNVVGGGDELLGLMRAFLSAGAASLVLSLWAVQDRSTAELMTCFYRKLAAGATKGAALRAAQLAFLQGADREGNGSHQHPYYWAPFFLVGHGGAL